MAPDSRGSTTPEPVPPEPTPPRSGSWTARPVLAWSIRFAIFAIPLIGAWLSVHFGLRIVRRPASPEGTVAWIGGALVLSTFVFYSLRRLLDRFSSLGVLYRLSLTFPDVAPSRLWATLKSGRIGDLDGQSDWAGEPATFGSRMQADRIADLVTTLSRREHLSRGHSDRVRAYSVMIAEEMGLPEDDIEKLQWAALLHDVGQLDTPARILDKRGPLDPDERALVAQHPVRAIGYLQPFSDWLGEWLLAATEHHERWDGNGYPAGLAGTEISLAGRIVAVADAYDAMTASRSYQRARSPSAARQELVDGAGTQFDPEVVRAFLNIGIRRSRAGWGPLIALVELPAQLGSLAPAVTASAGAAAAGTLAMVAVSTAPSVSTATELAPPGVERVVEETTTTNTTTSTSTTSTAPATSTTIPPRRTTSTTSTTTTSTTTTAPPRRSSTTSTSTTAPPTTTTTSTTTTTTTVPTYPTTPTTTIGYPVTGP